MMRAGIGVSFASSRRLAGETSVYPLCGVPSHFRLALAHTAAERPSAEELLDSPWIPFLPRQEASGWVLLDSVIVDPIDLDDPFGMPPSEPFQGMPSGGLMMVWLDSFNGLMDDQGAVICQGRDRADPPRIHILREGDRTPSLETLQARLEGWVLALLVWAYDRTGRLPETIEGWSDVIAFTEPTPETEEWIAEARALFQEALDYARERIGLGPGETSPATTPPA